MPDDEEKVTAEELGLMKMSLGYMEDGVSELSTVSDTQWAWALAVSDRAKRILRRKHSLETATLAAELMRDAISRYEADLLAKTLPEEQG